MGIAGLGAFAGGLNRGIQDGTRLRMAEEDQSFQNEQRGWARSDRKRADDQRAIDDEANAAARKVYESFGQQTPASLGAVQIGSPAEAGAPPGQAGLAAVQPAAPQEADEGKRVYAALKARADVYGKKGKLEQWMPAWKAAADVRAQLRQQEFLGADKKFRASGDPMAYAGVYDLIEDGNELVGAQRGLDGGVTLALKNKAGQVAQRTMKPDEFKRVIDFARDAPSVLKMEAQFAMEDHKAANAENRDAAREDKRAEREQANKKLEFEDKAKDRQSREKVAGMQAGATVKAATIRASASGGDGGNSGVGDRFLKTIVNDDGYVVGIPRNKNSAPVLLRLDGEPIRASEWTKRVDKRAGELAKGTGVLDMTPEQRYEKAAQMLLDEAAQGAAAKRSASGATDKRPPLDSFQR